MSSPGCCAVRTPEPATRSGPCGSSGAGSGHPVTAGPTGATSSPTLTRPVPPADGRRPNPSSRVEGITMTMTTPVRPASPTGIRPVAIAAVLLGDLVAPAGVYYAARALGAPVMLAVLLGGLTCLPRQVFGLARRGRIDGLGAAVIGVLVVSGLLSLLSGDARFMVVKDAVWPLAAGLVTGGSCLRGKPVTFFMLRPALTRGRAENRPFWDQ